MFNNHKMSVVTKLSDIGYEINDINHVCVATITTDNVPSASNIYNASILVPPTQILMRWADGDQFAIANLYPQYLLSNEDADSFIVSLIAALTQRNIVLYIPINEFQIFGGALLQHLYFVYGIQVESSLSQDLSPVPFAIMPEKMPIILSKLYMNDLIQPDVFIDSYPANCQLPDFVINKLAIELRPLDETATFMDYVNYFNGLIANKMSPKKVMIEVVDKK